MSRIGVICTFLLLCILLRVALLLRSAKTDTWLSYDIFSAIFFFSLLMMGHGMVADRSVGLGSCFIGFPI